MFLKWIGLIKMSIPLRWFMLREVEIKVLDDQEEDGSHLNETIQAEPMGGVLVKA